MREIDFYLPTTSNDGATIDPSLIREMKKELEARFGGYTQVTYQSEGAWRLGGLTFHDRIAIIRVLGEGNRSAELEALKSRFAKMLGQEQLLVVARDVTVI